MFISKKERKKNCLGNLNTILVYFMFDGKRVAKHVKSCDVLYLFTHTHTFWQAENAKLYIYIYIYYMTKVGKIIVKENLAPYLFGYFL